MTLLSLMGTLLSLFMWLGSKTGNHFYIMLAGAASLGGGGLMFYALYREQNLGDKSKTLSPKASGAMLSIVLLWVVFLFVRAAVS